MEKHYTIAEMGKIMSIPESTVRYYRDRFSQYIPCTGEGRKKRYPQKALEILRIIAEESNRNTTAEEIKSRLTTEFTSFVEIGEVIAENTAVAQQQVNLVPFEAFASISRSLETIVDKLNLYEQQQKTIEAQQKRIEKLEEQNQKIDDLQAQIKTLMESHGIARQQQDKILFLEDSHTNVQAKEKKSIWDIFRRS